ncbi:hypothetical protein WR25_05499 [Diploscapter pachys]|uniref:ATP-dependent RNA helicase Ski2/MTR4 C-terminal domain-containing protein n=1 Tax=Diploscapter pachys TaxID=2018661 RepID=A0A2A2LX30_9BILA|nr:hypothetical protein WR25_05499 [Diploscapter pachys]
MQIDKVSNEIRDGTIQMYTLSTDIKNAVKELDLSFMIDTVISQENAATSVDYPAKSCENLLEHIRYIRQKCVIEKEVEALKHSLSSSALMLSEDYKNRLNVLKYLDYISDENMVKFKGRVACEIHHQELFITELILSYKLHNRSFAEVAALISSTTCQTKTGNQVKFPKGSIFVELQEICQEQSKKIDEAVKAVKANIVAPRDEIQYELMEVVYEWAMGKPFAEIMEITDCQEGQIVRCIQRLGEVVKDVRNAARIVGDPTLFEKMEEVSAAIKRDIVFAASLYTTE